MASIIKKDHVSVSSVDQSSTRRRRGHAKTASLLRVEGEVRAIEVLCSCGERTVIELDYEDAVTGEISSTPAPESSAEPNAPAETNPEEEIPS